MTKLMINKLRTRVEAKPTRKLLSFLLGQIEFSLDILKVQEIKSLSELTINPIADVPDYIVGLINYNKAIVPLIDLHSIFHIKLEQQSDMKAAILLNVNQSVFGILVDNVSDIVEIPLDHIQPVRQMISTIQSDYVEGIIENKEKILFILNVDKLVSYEKLALTKRVNHD